jgi:para-aminobenzoate synthetase component 1
MTLRSATIPTESAVAVVRRLEPCPDPTDCLRRLSRLPGCVFFDSALRHPELGRYSFLAADPFDFVEINASTENVFPRLEQRLAPFRQPLLPGLPPFQGGLAGCFSYDLNRTLENIPGPRFDEFQIPLVSMGIYDVVVAWDHVREEAWLISQGFPETDPALRRRRAVQRADDFLRRISDPISTSNTRTVGSDAIPIDDLAPQAPTGLIDGLTSNLSADEYLAAIRAAVEYIWAGDVFQVNLAQRLLHPIGCDPVELYLRLRGVNPAPFAGYFGRPTYQVISASPERFFAIRQRMVETRPIKGTRRRTGFPESDLVSGFELLSSPKDRSENVMIVDLLRNDLSRCCEDDSIEVTQLCGLERFPTVLHLVSAIRGRLSRGGTAADVWTAMFPGGSVTGAPKVRAMEIIAELEPTARGPYCGSLAYIGWDGTVDASILIRTITASQGWWQMPVGGGIVAMSDPRREYDETWTKATGLLRAIYESTH